jgi:hypothetical protein
VIARYRQLLSRASKSEAAPVTEVSHIVAVLDGHGELIIVPDSREVAANDQSKQAASARSNVLERETFQESQRTILMAEQAMERARVRPQPVRLRITGNVIEPANMQVRHVDQ